MEHSQTAKLHQKLIYSTAQLILCGRKMTQLQTYWTFYQST